jgi:hypothetical protein
MAGRKVRLGYSRGKSKVDNKVRVESLDYHEGLSPNQVKIILRECGLYDRIDNFNDWLYGQTAPVIKRFNSEGKVVDVGGIYEYDLFRWIANQKKGTPLIWD